MLKDKSTSIVTIIRNRNNVLRKTIHNWLKFDIPEIIIVDFRDDSCESVWDIIKPLNDSRIKVIETKYEYRFILGVAANLGFTYTTFPYVLKLDVDYLLSDDFFIQNTIRENEFVTGYWKDPTSGLLYTEKHWWNLCNGYNENILYWGADDVDLYSRMRQQKLVHKYVVKDTITHQEHAVTLSLIHQFQWLPSNILNDKVGNHYYMDKEQYDVSNVGVINLKNQVQWFTEHLLKLIPWTPDVLRIQWKLEEIEPNRYLAIRSFN